MQPKAKTLIAFSLVTIMLVGSLPVNADHEPPVEIGEFERLGMEDELTEDDTLTTDRGLKVEAPGLSSELRVDVSYLEERVGEGFAADRAFDIVGDQVVLPGADTEFVPFEPSEESVFTMGSSASLRFTDRPMWVSVAPGEDGSLVLDMEDGDTSGQDLYIAKEWLWARGMHRPVATHEDGYGLTVTESDDHQGFTVAIPHFTQVILTPADIDVKGRQGGAPFVHTGVITWDDVDQRLEIDIGLKLSDYDLLVETDWFEVNMPSPALYDHEWVVENVSGTYYYVVEVPAEETPVPVVFEEFAAPITNAFTRGNLTGIHFTSAVMTTIHEANASLNVSVLSGLPSTGSYLTLNVTYMLEGLGVSRPAITSSVGRIHSWGVLDYTWLQIPVPPNSTWLSISQSPDVTDPSFAFVADVESALSLGEKCHQALGDNQEVASTTAGQSEAGIYVAGTSFCFEWSLFDSRADYYNVVIGLTDGQNEVKCGTGEETNQQYKSQDTFKVCEWPDGGTFPVGQVSYTIDASAWWFQSPGDKATASYVKCQIAMVAIPASAAAGFFFAPAWTLLAPSVVFAAEHCTEYTLTAEAPIYAQDEEVGAEILILSGTQDSLVGTNEVTLYDPGDKRGDTWSDLEWHVPGIARDPSWDGYQRARWTLKDVFDGAIVYASDISIVRDLAYPSWEMDLTWGAGGFQGSAIVTSFSGSHGGIGHTNDILVQDGGSDALDWEANEPQCVLLDTIESNAQPNLHMTLTTSTNPNLGCGIGQAFGLEVLDNNDANGETDPNAPWLSFALGDHSLGAEAILANGGTLTLNDVLNETGNITRAVAKKLTQDSAFISGIYKVQIVDGYGIAGTTACEFNESPHESTFSVSVEGVSIAGSIPLADADSFQGEVCFDPLLGIAVEELESI